MNPLTKLWSALHYVADNLFRLGHTLASLDAGLREHMPGLAWQQYRLPEEIKPEEIDHRANGQLPAPPPEPAPDPEKVARRNHRAKAKVE